MTNSQKLFAEFEPVSKDRWKEAAIKDLKGADFDKKLVWKTDEGLNVHPFYTSEDLAYDDVNIFRLKGKKNQWSNFVEVDTISQDEANKFIRKMVSFDIDGVLLKIDAPEEIDFTVLLNDIDPGKLQIAFKLQDPSSPLIKKYFDYLDSNNISLNDIKGFVQSDILEEWSVTGKKPDFQLLADQLKITARAENFKGLMLASHSFVNAGAGIVQELAFTLNKLTDTIESLEKKGLKDQQIIDELAFHLAIGGDYFFELAKLRAFRPVLNAVISTYTFKIPDVPILSSNSTWSKTLYDGNVNMLRNTTEAMSAILGGCDSILINPHDSTFRDADESDHRIAINISNLLKHESYFDKVMDPAAGSYYIENITSGIASKTLELFKEIEIKGGYIDAFKKGIISEKIDALRLKKENEIATRKRVYVGTNKYPNLQEKVNLEEYTDISAHTADYPLLHPQRAAQNFEWLRQITQHESEVTDRLPKVWLATFGNLAMRKARASFSSEFFGTAGFEIMGEFFTDDVVKGARESAESDADIVVMCSADADYATDAKTFAETFRQINNNKKLILAGYPTDLIESLKEAGVDDFIHVKTDVIEFITVLQGELFAVL